MAKRHQKSNREIRKPKGAKTKPVEQASTFERSQAMGVPKKGGGGKQVR